MDGVVKPRPIYRGYPINPPSRLANIQAENLLLGGRYADKVEIGRLRLDARAADRKNTQRRRRPTIPFPDADPTQIGVAAATGNLDAIGLGDDDDEAILPTVPTTPPAPPGTP